ncbi:MAG: hypothetical protein ACN4GZ_20085 [Acidimicrobiales bacterium]
MFADTFGQPLKIQTLPKPLMSALGLFNGDIKELKEMLYQWERPFLVDGSKFADRFWSDVTPWDAGVTETARSYSTS